MEALKGRLQKTQEAIDEVSLGPASKRMDDGMLNNAQTVQKVNNCPAAWILICRGVLLVIFCFSIDNG